MTFRSRLQTEGKQASSRRIIFVGPAPIAEASQHPGGQLTAAGGVTDYARKRGYEIHISNTLIHNFPPPSFGRKVMLGVKRALLFARTLQTTRVDGVILFVGSRYSFFERVLLVALAKASGAKTVFCIREGAFVDWMNTSFLTRHLVPILLRLPDHIVVQGSRFALALEDARVPREKLVTIPNWLPGGYEIALHPKRADGQSPLRLIFVGWLVKEKGVRELMTSFEDLSRRFSVTLDVIGGGTLEQELREAAKGQGRLTIHGWLSASAIRQHLDQAQVFVLPTYFEGFPNALLEAMARGLPAICSDVGAIGGSLDHGRNGFLIPPRDADALSRAIMNYLQDPSVVEKHSVATLSKVRAVHDRETNLARLFALLD